MQQNRIIWAAMLFSTVIYGFIIWMMSLHHPQRPFEEVLRQPQTLALYGVALLDFIAATVASVVMRDRPQRLRMILTLALYEACAIFGLVAAFIAFDWRLYLAPWALAVIG